MGRLPCLLIFLPILLGEQAVVVMSDECTASNSQSFKWFIGDTMRWNCTLLSDCPAGNASDMYFYGKNEDMPANLSRVVDARTRELVIHNVTREYAGAYYCYIGNQRKRLNDGIEMRVGSHLSEPTVSVVWQWFHVFGSSALVVEASPAESDRNLTENIKWDIRYKLHHKRPRRLDGSYAALNTNCKKYVKDADVSCNSSKEWACGCPETEEDGRVCFLTNAGGIKCLQVDRSLTYQFHVTMETDFSKISKNYTIKVSYENFTFSKPPTMSGCKFVNQSARSGAVQWSTWSSLGAGVLEHNLFYRSMSQWDDHIWQGPINTRDTLVELKGLRPATKHEVKIESKFTVSDLVNTALFDFSTAEDVPSSSPQDTVGSYSDIPCSTCKDRNIFVYIQSIPQVDWNGKLTNYKITVVEETSSVSRTTIVPINQTETLRVNNLNRGLSYRVEVSASTAVGWTQVPSSITIPALPDKPALPSNIIAMKMGAGRIQLTWNVANSLEYENSQYNYTVHWCDTGSSESFFEVLPQCKEDYSWATISGSVHAYNISLSVEHLAHYRYGVSLDVLGEPSVSSGISWSKCLYDAQQGPGDVLDLAVRVERQPVTGKSSLDLTWRPAECRYGQVGFPSLYEVRYSRDTAANSSTNLEDWCSNVENNLTVNVTKLKIEGIEAGHLYSACVRASSNRGHSSWIIDKALIEYTSAPDRYRAVPVGIGISVSIAALICLIIGFIVLRYYCSRVQDKIEIVDTPIYPYRNENTYGFTAIEDYADVDETPDNNEVSSEDTGQNASSSERSDSSAGSSHPLVPPDQQSRHRSSGVESPLTGRFVSANTDGDENDSMGDSHPELAPEDQAEDQSMPISKDESIPWSAGSASSITHYAERKNIHKDSVHFCPHSNSDPASVSTALTDFPLMELNPIEINFNPKVLPGIEDVKTTGELDEPARDRPLHGSLSGAGVPFVGNNTGNNTAKYPTEEDKMPKLKEELKVSSGTGSQENYSRYAELDDSSASLSAMTDNLHVKGQMLRTTCSGTKGVGTKGVKDSKDSKKSGLEKTGLDV